MGPTSGAILGLAGTTRGTGPGALLIAVYSAGLALPLLFTAVAFDAATRVRVLQAPLLQEHLMRARSGDVRIPIYVAAIGSSA